MFTTLPSPHPPFPTSGIPPDAIICSSTEWPPLVKAKDTTSVPLGKGEGFVFVFTPSVDGWSLTSDDAWLSQSSTESGDSFVELGFGVEPNPGPDRKGTIKVSKEGQTLKSFQIYQSGGLVLSTLKEMILDPPTSTGRGKYPPFSALIMELGILGKFIATEIRQSPPIDWPLALAAVSAAIAATSAALIAGRLAFAGVPEPPDYFSSDHLRMETELISKQALLLAEYINEQVLAGE